MGEGPGIQDGLVFSVREESSPFFLLSLWPGPCPKEAAVRVAVERETEARSWAGIWFPHSCPVVSLLPVGVGWAQRQSCPVLGGLGPSPRFGIAVGHCYLSLFSLSSLGSVLILGWYPSGGGRRGQGKFFSIFMTFSNRSAQV